MVALSPPAPARTLSRKQRRREERRARQLAASQPLAGSDVQSAEPSIGQSAPTDPTPPPPTIDELIEDYLTLDLPLTALAKRRGLSLAALCERIESGEFQATLARLNAIAANRAQDIALHARALALDTLARILSDPDAKPETARKAAATLIRASDPPPARRASASQDRTDANAIHSSASSPDDSNSERDEAGAAGQAGSAAQTDMQTALRSPPSFSPDSGGGSGMREANGREGAFAVANSATSP